MLCHLVSGSVETLNPESTQAADRIARITERSSHVGWLDCDWPEQSGVTLVICVVVVRLTVSEVMVWAFSTMVESLSVPVVSADWERDTFWMLDDAELGVLQLRRCTVQSNAWDYSQGCWDTLGYRQPLRSPLCELLVGNIIMLNVMADPPCAG